MARSINCTSNCQRLEVEKIGRRERSRLTIHFSNMPQQIKFEVHTSYWGVGDYETSPFLCNKLRGRVKNQMEYLKYFKSKWTIHKLLINSLNMVIIIINGN